MFRNIRKFVTLYLSLNPCDRVKTCVVPTCIFLFVFFISLSSQHGNSQKQVIGVPGSYEQKGCILKVVGKESIDNKGNISTVRFVDREQDSKCLLTVIGRRQVSVRYLNFDLNHRPRLSGGTNVIVYFVRSRGGWRAWSITTLENEVMVWPEQVDGYFEFRVLEEQAMGVLLLCFSLVWFLLMFFPWYRHLRGVPFRQWGDVVIEKPDEPSSGED